MARDPKLQRFAPFGHGNTLTWCCTSFVNLGDPDFPHVYWLKAWVPGFAGMTEYCLVLVRIEW
jgi:hypothetical protein